MKIKLLSLLVAIPMFLTYNSASAQTTLSAGDIAIIQAQADTPDDFAFVTFVDIAEGTGIYFTDCGSTATGFISCTEGAVKYTAPVGGLNAGDIIQFGGNGSFNSYSDGTISGTFALATSGDQILVFQDSTDPAGGANAAANANFIYAANLSSTLFTGNPPDSNETNLPPGLNDTGSPRTAIGLGNGPEVDNEWDNAIYNGTYDFSGFATEAEALNAAKVAMTDPANYTKTNAITDPTYSGNVASMPGSINLTTLSNEDFVSNSFAIYPNPSNGNITIKNSGVALQNVTVTDVNGRTMASFEMNGVTTNTDLNLNLNTGMYFVRLTSNDASTTKKMIIK